jgi:hypothetical protein
MYDSTNVMSVRPSFRTEKRESYQTDFPEVSYLGILLKHVNTVNFGYNKIKIADT